MPSAARDNLGVKKVEAPSKCPEKRLKNGHFSTTLSSLEFSKLNLGWKYWRQRWFFFWGGGGGGNRCLRWYSWTKILVEVSWHKVESSRTPGSRIQKQQQKRGGKSCCHTFFCSNKLHKTENYFIFEMLQKKIWVNFQGIIKLISWKFGFGIRGQKAPDPGFRIRIRNTAFLPSPAGMS